MHKISKTIITVLLGISVLIPSVSCAAEKEVTVREPSFDDAVVSFLGPEGTYTQEACERFMGEGRDLTAYETVPAAVDALVSGDSDYAVIPIENTIGGAVTDYIDTLMSNATVSVVGEVELPINQNLLVIPGTELSDIKTVYSHKQGIAQGRDWLAANLPDAEIVEVSSTAEGARMVSEGGDSSCAAIASAGCADVYGLEILAPAIQNNDQNVTRFYVLKNAEPDVCGTDRTSFIATGSAEDLSKLLVRINANGIRTIAVHDRPLKTELGQYSYLIECSCISPDVFEGIKASSLMDIRYLGSFNVK